MKGYRTGRSIIALAGRRIDAPGSASPRFPLDMTHRVRERLRDVMLNEGAVALVASAACGADLIALDVAAQLGLRRRIVLPLPADRFRNLSVVDRPGDWSSLFDPSINDARAAGDLVVLDTDHSPVDGSDADGAALDAAFAAATGRILQEAEALAGEPGTQGLRVVGVLVWDGVSRGADDHTAAFGRLVRERGHTVIEVATDE